MSENYYDYTRPEDENARDEFSAAHVFKRKNDADKLSGVAVVKRKIAVLRDITAQENSSQNSLNIQRNLKVTSFKRDKPGIESLYTSINKTGFKFSVQNDKSGTISITTDSLSQSRDFFRYPRDKSDSCFDGDDESDVVELKRRKTVELIDELECNNRFLIDVNETDSTNVSLAFSPPANGYNGNYTNHIFVPEYLRSPQIVSITEDSVTWISSRHSSLVNTEILLSSQRKWCSPQQQFVITDNNQYKSQCLINSYFSLYSKIDSFKTAVGVDVTQRFRGRSNLNISLMPQTLNTSYFHELFVEKLKCNQSFDFMPSCNSLTGRILGGFVNDLFELSKDVCLQSEIIHIAVDYIYQYLSRVHNVPPQDVKWITLASIWVAAKYEGSSILERIKEFADCQLHHLRRSELRLLMVIDFNVTKPHAIFFRNRLLLIEQSNSTVLHLSSFILDMILHCYTLMLLPASLRAAAAMWLARLVDKFSEIRLNDEIWSNMSLAAEKMNSVWPDNFEKLSGYSHKDLSFLGIKMHVIIIAFLSSGEDKHPSVSGCHEKYSSLIYGRLTSSYEKFTAATVFYASNLYCRVNNLELRTWMEEKEFDTLWHNFCENRVKLNRSTSYCNPEMVSSMNSNSCPELSMKPIVSRQLLAANNSNYSNVTISKDSILESNTNKVYRFQKFDSGYSTSSNL